MTEGTTSKPEGLTMLVFSGDLDKALAAFVVANGALAMDMPVTMFFAFWGLNMLRRPESVPVNKDLISRMFGWMMPRGISKLNLSQMHMCGMGTFMMKGVMKNKKIQSLPEMLETAKSQGVRLIACTMSMDVMGIKKEELIDGVELAGVATFLGSADTSKSTLFI